MRNTSIIILTYNNLNYTKNCMESIRKYTKENTYELIVVDNHSTDGTVEWLKKETDIKLLLNKENLGFPKGCNQGIAISQKENDILLLNNDTIVTSNWLDNLKRCLYSDPAIGAVGPVCNQNENLQGVDFTYQDLEEMQALAEKNNKSNPAKWEEKVFLIGYCLLIKREVIDKLHALDEMYTPGYIEDNDLCLRILNQNYKLMLCHDCFIHHYLGTSFRKDLNKFYPILNKNREYFEKKWGFNTFSFDELKDASLKILEPRTRILDWQCGIGINMLKIKYMYPHVVIDGYEENEEKAKIASHVGKVYKNEQLKEQEYDIILIGRALEIVDSPHVFLTEMDKYLKKGGFIIGEIENASSIKYIKSLLEDRWYSKKSQKNLFTIEDITELFQQIGYTRNHIFSWYEHLKKQDEKLSKHLKILYPKNYQVTYYSFRFQK